MQAETTNPSHERKHRAGTLWRGIATVVLLGFVGIVVQQVAFSSASISWKTSNPGNTQNAGSFSFNSTKDGQVVISAPSMAPGDVKTGTVTLTGAGDYSGAYTLTRTSLVDVPASPAFSATLRLRIEQENPSGTPIQLYDGTLSAFSSLSLGTLAIGASRTYIFTLTFPTSGANPALQGATTTATLAFTGVAQ